MVFLIAMAAGCEFAADIYLPSFPTLAHVFQTTPSMISLTITAYLLGQALFQLVYGPIADRYGRKHAVLLGVAVCLVGSVICWFSNSISLFIIGRILQGAGAAAGISMALAITRDSFSEESMAKILSIIILVYSLTFAAAPILGGYFEHYLSWKANFYFTFIYFVALLACTIFFKETLAQRNLEATRIKTMLANYKRLLTSKTFMGYMFCATLPYVGMIAYAALSPFLFQNVLHMSPIAYGWLSLYNTAALCASTIFNMTLLGKFGLKRMTVIGTILLTISGLIMWLIGIAGVFNVLVVMLPMFVFVFGAGVLAACGSAGSLAPFGDIAGSAGALWSALQFFTVFLFSIIAAHLHSNTQTILGFFLVVLSLLTWLAYIWVKQGSDQDNDKGFTPVVAH
jgi:DHA1 family bicyclomycin/chloramphenicol resistance-like MFS transporter/DHA1 family 2-module integral membrane pump EmrD-like MFS transporter